MDRKEHTRGPWFITKDSSHNEVARVGRAWNIATRLALSEMGDLEKDATLLANAPEMLTALHDCLAIIKATGADVKWLEDVIKDAEGR